MARPPLTRDKILDAALALADRAGLDALSMRRLGRELGVEAMSVYHHLANKEAVLDGLADRVWGLVSLPEGEGDALGALAVRCRSLRDTLRAHPWAAPLLVSRRQPGPATLAHTDALVACLRRAGLSWADTGHAMALVDGFLYGFVQQEGAVPWSDGTPVAEVAAGVLEAAARAYPSLTGYIREHALAPGYDFGAEFEWGLQKVLGVVRGLADAGRLDRDPGPRVS